MGKLVEDAKIISEIKRLNQRMRDLERKGLTDTISYQRLSSWAANMDNEVRDGYIRARQTAKITPAQAKRTHALASRKQFTAGAEIKRATRFLKENEMPATREDAIRQANEYGRLEEHVRSNLDKLYIHMMSEDTENRFTARRKQTFINIMKDDMMTFDEKIKKFDAWHKRTWKFTTDTGE